MYVLNLDLMINHCIRILILNVDNLLAYFTKYILLFIYIIVIKLMNYINWQEYEDVIVLIVLKSSSLNYILFSFQNQSQSRNPKHIFNYTYLSCIYNLYKYTKKTHTRHWKTNIIFIILSESKIIIAIQEEKTF